MLLQLFPIAGKESAALLGGQVDLGVGHGDVLYHLVIVVLRVFQ
jgi:hypothetical protein